MHGIFALKTQKTGPGEVSLTIPKPVFSDFTVFWAVFALKARKLPDLSGRQIRQLIWRRVRDSNPRGREPKRFSRPPRYDHFDNSPYQKSTLMGTFLAQKEGFEPSRAFYTPTPLAGEPLRPLGYFCTMPLKYNSIAQRHCQEFSQQMRT